MIAFLWAAGVAADPSQSIANPAHRRAAQQCQASLARKGGGEVSNLTVVEFHQIGGKTLLKGTMNVLQRPASRPGEMTPTHIIAMRYSYECRLRGRAAPRVNIAPLAG
ncbi:MAG: hypothetical protein QOH81_1656 [Sphingomonadales bacterium]|jgi:hypothetical protein|nr:hypothetical protein [Sphingomonadales bacterium]